jgi:hypothetical protein
MRGIQEGVVDVVVEAQQDGDHRWTLLHAGVGRHPGCADAANLSRFKADAAWVIDKGVA